MIVCVIYQAKGLFSRIGDARESFSVRLSVRLSAMRKFPVYLLASACILAGVASASVSTIAAAVSVRPVLTNISPKSGPATGGTLVTLHGSHFVVAANKTKVHFGRKTANATCVSTSVCVATAPKGTGKVGVSVSTSGGTSAIRAADHFTYVGPRPSGSGGGSPASITLSGTGQSATRTFTVTTGLAVFTAKCQCTANFSVEIDKGSGATVDIPINVIGAYTGSVAEGLKAGSYLLNITADGAWSVVVTQPRNIRGLSLPHTYSGSGQMVVGPVNGGSALRLAAHNQSSQGGNFAVTLLDSNGNMQDIPFNEIGSFNGSTISNNLSGGPYYLEIDSDGSWTIQVSNG